jgi:hypothetical protein
MDMAEFKTKAPYIKKSLQPVGAVQVKAAPKRDERCIGCRWSTPKALGGDGMLCDGKEMHQFNTCPGWVISWYRLNHRPHNEPFSMIKMVEENKL